MTDYLTRPTKGAGGNWWNFSDDTREDYSKEIKGTVINVASQQAFFEGVAKQTKKGKDIYEIVLTLKTDGGQASVSTGSTWSVLYKCFWHAIDETDPTATNLDWLLGKVIAIATHGPTKKEREAFIAKNLAWYDEEISPKARAFCVAIVGTDEDYESEKDYGRPKAAETDWE